MIPIPAFDRVVGFEVRAPFVTASLNQSRRDHWSKSMRRTKTERSIIWIVLRAHKKPPLPAVVTMVRCSPRSLDDDNLVGSFKHVRDEIAKWIGVDDADPRVTWRVEQRKVARKDAGTVVRVEERR